MFRQQYHALFAVGLLIQSGLVVGQKQEKIEKKKSTSDKKVTTIESIRQKIDQAPADADVKLFTIIGDFLTKIPIPEPAKSLFNKEMVMRNLQVVQELPRSPYIRSGIGFTGSLFFNKVQVKGTVYVVIDRSLQPQVMIVVDMPDRFKISDMFPGFRVLNMFSLPKPRLVLATFEHYGPDGGLLKPGFYFNASLDLAGPLDALREMKQQAKQLDSIIVEDEPITFLGKIPVKATYQKINYSVVFGSEIPIRVGIDFRKIPGFPSPLSDIFQKLTTDNFNLKVALYPKLAITIETGVRLTLGTQKDPLRLTGVGVIAPEAKKFSLGIRMKNMLELKWLALGNAAIQVDFPGASGLPISGLGYFGQIDVGKAGESRATFKVAAKVSLTGKKDKEVALPGDDAQSGETEVIGMSSPVGVLSEISAENVRMQDVVEVWAQMGRKAKVLKMPFPSKNIPVMHINKVRGYVAIDSVTIANKFYKAGFKLTLDGQLFDQKLLLNVEILHKELKMSGIGYLSNINFVLQGKPIFSLTGPGIDQQYDTKDDGPIFFCDLNAMSPGSALFGLRGKLNIPPLAVRAKTDMVFHGTSLKADIEAEFPGFTGLFRTYINPLNFKDMYVRLGFKQDFETFLSNQAKTILQEVKTNTIQRLTELNQTIGDLSQAIQGVGKKSSQVAEKEIAKTKKTIERVRKKIKDLNASCNKAAAAQKKKTCRKISIKVVRQQAALKLQELYLEQLLKPGKKVAAGATQIIGNATKELKNAQLVKKGVEATLNNASKALDGIAKAISLFQVKEAFGRYTAKEMAEGKLPTLERLVVSVAIPGIPPKTITLKNVQFDFKDVAQSAQQVVRTILRTVNFIE